MSSFNRLAWLDSLRAIAVVLVLVGHGKQAFGHQSSGAGDALFRILNAHLGVQAFFVISGFIITLLLQREKAETGDIDLKAFWLRRAYRILPALLLFFVALGLLQLFGMVHVDVATWASAFLFYRNYAGEGWFTGHLWSLGVEAQFYLLWPLFVVYLLPRRLGYVVIGGIMIALVTRCLAAIHRIPHLSFYSLPGNLDLLMFGAIAAIYIHERQKKAIDRPMETLFEAAIQLRILLFVALLAAFLSFLMNSRWSLWAMVLQPVLVGVFLSVILVVAYDKGAPWRLLSFGPVPLLGAWSYSLYLWQQLFLAPVDAGIFSDFRGGNVVLLSFALMLAGLASYYSVERPFNRIGHKHVASMKKA